MKHRRIVSSTSMHTQVAKKATSISSIDYQENRGKDNDWLKKKVVRLPDGWQQQNQQKNRGKKTAEGK